MMDRGLLDVGGERRKFESDGRLGHATNLLAPRDRRLVRVAPG
jgi:hypothetical protein